MIPIIEGKVHHFKSKGLYNGIPMLFDLESESYWNLVTGECLYGPLQGMQLDVSPLLPLSVYQAYTTFPDLEVAFSHQHMGKRLMGNLIMRWGTKILNPLLHHLADKEDGRLPRFAIGLGVWTDEGDGRFYPVPQIKANHNVVIDHFNGRQLLIYCDPRSNIPAALWTTAESAHWDDDDVLRLSNGHYWHSGILYNPGGMRREPDLPLQMYSRWYGFSYTFPGCTIYEASGMTMAS